MLILTEVERRARATVIVQMPLDTGEEAIQTCLRLQ